MDRNAIAITISGIVETAIRDGFSGIDISLDCGSDKWSYVSYENSEGEEETHCIDRNGCYSYHALDSEMFTNWSESQQ